MRPLFAIAACGLAGCAMVDLAPPRLSTRTGVQPATAISRVVALPATCGTLTSKYVQRGREFEEAPAECAPLVLAAADAAVRSGIAFRGLHVIDSESLNAGTATRRETQIRTETLRETEVSTSHDLETSTTIERHGPRFEDVSPIEQRAILRELGADGLLTTRIFIGAPLGMSARRTVHVQIRLVAADDFALVWSRRCELEVAGLLATDALSIERGARCAVEGS